VLLWFVGGAVTIVWFVFRDPSVDYRVVALGAVLPDIVDGLFGGAWVMHSVTGSIVLLVVVMLSTIGHRAARKRWLGLPIGTFLHLVLDGAFADTRVFWWPFTGVARPDVALPSVDRGLWNLLLEVAGAAMLVWCWRRFELADPERRRALVRTGHVVAP
jgi:hypothetical protein